MSSYKPTKTPGVRYAEHGTRKHGRQKDKYFTIRYQNNKKTKEEGVGWASQGWTEQKVAALLFELKENISLGRDILNRLQECANLMKNNRKIKPLKNSKVKLKKLLYVRFLIVSLQYIKQRRQKKHLQGFMGFILIGLIKIWVQRNLPI